jgi:hypothetical protein
VGSVVNYWRDYACAALGIEAEILLRSAALPRDKQKIGAESPTPPVGRGSALRALAYYAIKRYNGFIVKYAKKVINI